MPRGGGNAGRRTRTRGATSRKSLRSLVCLHSVRAHHSKRAGMLMAREFPKSQIRLNGPNKSGRSRFDKKENPGKLQELHPGKFERPNWPAGSNKSNQGRFDKTKEPGKLKESPRGTERKFRNTESVCFLRTQQRAKSQCIIYVQNPRRGWFFGAGSTDIAMMFELMVG